MLKLEETVIGVSRNSASIESQLEAVHASIRVALPAISRVAVAVYDGRTDILKTFIHSTEGDSPFSHYEAKLADVPSLAELAYTHGERIIEDFHSPGQHPGPHDRQPAG